MNEGKPEIRLSEDAVREFKEIYRDKYGVKLLDADANRMGVRLLRLFEIPLNEKKVPGPG